MRRGSCISLHPIVCARVQLQHAQYSLTGATTAESSTGSSTRRRCGPQQHVRRLLAVALSYGSQGRGTAARPDAVLEGRLRRRPSPWSRALIQAAAFAPPYFLSRRDGAAPPWSVSLGFAAAPSWPRTSFCWRASSGRRRRRPRSCSNCPSSSRHFRVLCAATTAGARVWLGALCACVWAVRSWTSSPTTPSS